MGTIDLIVYRHDKAPRPWVALSLVYSPITTAIYEVMFAGLSYVHSISILTISMETPATARACQCIESKAFK